MWFVNTHKMQGFFNMALPKQMKRKFRQEKCLVRWIRLQKNLLSRTECPDSKNIKI